MNFVNQNQVNQDIAATESAMQSMSQLAKKVLSDGLNIDANTLFAIATGRKSLTSIYQEESNERVKDSPAYVKQEENSRALARANSYQKEVDELRKFRVIGKFKAEHFRIDLNGNVSFTGDLQKEATALNTKVLTQKQEQLIKSIETFKKALQSFNKELAEINIPEVVVKVPFLNFSNEVDLAQIINVNHEAIQAEKQTAIENQKQFEGKKEKHKKYLESLFPMDMPERKETIERYMSIDPDGSQYDKSFYEKIVPKAYQPEKKLPNPFAIKVNV